MNLRMPLSLIIGMSSLTLFVDATNAAVTNSHAEHPLRWTLKVHHAANVAIDITWIHQILGKLLKLGESNLF
jgi:hypothetical protein